MNTSLLNVNAGDATAAALTVIVIVALSSEPNPLLPVTVYEAPVTVWFGVQEI